MACSTGRQVFHGRSLPVTAPGKSICGFCPKPTCEYSSHISRGDICIAIFTVPTLLDFWITPATVRAPWGWVSRICEPVMTIVPGEVSITVSGVTRPDSSAQAATKGFIVEPGSKMSVSARLRSCSPVRFWRCPGLKLGTLASARISPLRASSTTALPALAPCCSTASRSRCQAKNWTLLSIDSTTSLPCRGSTRLPTSSTMRPSRSRTTRREPSSPCRRAWKASSMPSWPVPSMPVKPTMWAAASPSG